MSEMGLQMFKGSNITLYWSKAQDTLLDTPDRTLLSHYLELYLTVCI